ncbi:MAG: hypothetical protein WBO73_19465, partial [Gammaproteobacteria bacterium]
CAPLCSNHTCCTDFGAHGAPYHIADPALPGMSTLTGYSIVFFPDTHASNSGIISMYIYLIETHERRFAM